MEEFTFCFPRTRSVATLELLMKDLCHLFTWNLSRLNKRKFNSKDLENVKTLNKTDITKST